MGKLYIHIGFHKTGSTSLQYALKNSAEELGLSGVKFLSANGNGNSSEFVTVNAQSSRVQVSITKRFFDLLRTGAGGNAIISAEHLSLIDELGELARLKSQADRFYDEIEIIAYVRRQDKLAISLKQQAAKQAHRGASPSSLLTGHDYTTPLPDLNWTLFTYLQYQNKVELWSEVFGAENVKLRVYDRAFLHGGCVCKDFSHLLELPFGVKSYNVNEGFGVMKTYLKHYLIDKRAPALLTRLMNNLVIDDADYVFVEKPVSTAAFMQFFDAGNRSLALNDFEMKAMTANHNVVYAEPRREPDAIITELFEKHDARLNDSARNFLTFMNAENGRRAETGHGVVHVPQLDRYQGAPGFSGLRSWLRGLGLRG